MKKIPWSLARFIASAPTVEKMPLLKNIHGEHIPEVALLGRSNVGKSSLLNSLFQLKGLVKTSSTPGKTQSLNLFAIEEAIAFADLPGYGYAKIPEAMQREWAPMVRGYLEGRQSLRGILWLLDIRRDPGDDERGLLKWFLGINKPFLLVLTKADQVKKHQVATRCNQIQEALGMVDLRLLPVSTKEQMGRIELISELVALL